MKKQLMHSLLITLPILCIFLLSLIYGKQFSLPSIKNDTVVIENLHHNELYQLKDGWKFYGKANTEVVPFPILPAKIETPSHGILTLTLQVPQEKQLYSLTLNGLDQPFKAIVNKEAVPVANDTIHFYATQQQIHIQLVIQNETNHIGMLQTPIFGYVHTIQNFQLKRYLFAMLTIVTLVLLALYCIVHYLFKQRHRQQLYIGIYFLLITFSILLSEENVGISLLPDLPAIFLVKLKTIVGLLCAWPLVLIVSHYRATPLSKRVLHLLFAPICLTIGIVIFAPKTSYALLEIIIWLYLIAFLIVQLLLVARHYYKNNLLTWQVIFPLHAFTYLVLYLFMRIYYAIVGSDFQSYWLLLVFVIFIFSSLMLQMTELVSKLEHSKISFFNAQIKPHFIYNAISNIIALCYTDHLKAAALLTKFSMYLRLIFEKNDAKSTVPLSEELALIDAYVEIEQARFPNRITYTLVVADDLLALRVPAFSIQPFIENAIRHGLFNSDKPGLVTLTITESDRQLVIRIEDNGIGMSEEMVQLILAGKSPNQGIGIINVKQRLLLLANVQLHIQSTPNIGTIITIQFPLNEGGHVC